MLQLIRKFFTKSFDENLSDYPVETSIHCVKYLANRSRPTIDRIFWSIIFLSMILCFGYFVCKIGHTWKQHPVIITNRNKPTPIYEIPFPAVTICPQIKIKRNKLDFSDLVAVIKQFSDYSDFMSSSYGGKFTVASQICRKSFQKYTQFLWQSKPFENSTRPRVLPNDWFNILDDMSPKLEDVFEVCEMSSWNIDEPYWNIPSKKNCERLFSTIITNEGICFTFNTIRDIMRPDSLQTDFSYHNITQNRDGWDPEKGYTKAKVYPFKGIIKGSPVGPSGLKFVLVANLSDVTPFCNPQDVGYKILLHSPSAYPQMYNNERFISLAHGKEYKIAAIPKTIKANDNMRSFDAEIRQCYYNDERLLKYYTFYNEENCRLECYANYSTKLHRGAPFSSPRDSNTTNCIMPHKNFGWDLPEYIELFYQHYKVFGKPKVVAGSTDLGNCHCLPECNGIHYDGKILRATEDFSFETAEMDEDSVQTTVEIIFKESSFIGQKRVRLYTFETIISNFGGLLGLFMGGSLLSVFELVYFLTIRNCFELKVDTVPD